MRKPMQLNNLLRSDPVIKPGNQPKVGNHSFDEYDLQLAVGIQTETNLRIPFLEFVNQLLYLLNGELLIILMVRIVTQAVLEGVYGLGI